jgi:hypothetical protein
MVRGLSRVNYKIPRLFQVARRCSKVFQKFSASLVLYELEMMFKVCRDDMPYMISYCSIVGGVREQLLVSSGRHILRQEEGRRDMLLDDLPQYYPLYFIVKGKNIFLLMYVEVKIPRRRK